LTAAVVFIFPIRFIKEVPEELVAHGWPHWLAVAFCLLVGLLGMVVLFSLLVFPLRVLLATLTLADGAYRTAL